MVRVSTLNDALNTMLNAEKKGKRQVLLRPSSKVVIKFLEHMMKRGMSLKAFSRVSKYYEITHYFSLISKTGYIGEFEFIDDHRGGKVVVELLGRINKCAVVSPRYDVKLPDIDKWTKNLLPSRQFGYVLFTTSYGIIDHEEAKKRGLGGKILGFFY